MTFPGGPALLEMTSSTLASVDNAREAASFLIKAHSIKEVVLVAHEGCGYYRARYRYESSEAMQRRQFADLRSAARWVSGTHSGVVARCFFASVAATPNGPRVTFSLVE
jgi:carbonic anhydrase